MKRFRRSGAKFEKNGKHVTLPAVLDLSDYLLTEETCGRLRPHLASDCKELICKSEGGSRFEIYGICVHKGGSLQSGHYIAFINVGPSLAEEKWYGASDTHVWSCSRSEVLEAQAYVAFYRKIEEPNAFEEVEENAQADLDGELPPEGSTDQEDLDA
ncbi:usp16 [Symbiodinium sp. CCMP2592]|nr:usp16 [Symbiodinium sp. CCMP2592]